LCAFAVASSPALVQAPPRPSVFQTTLEEAAQLTPEITTEELLAILASNSEPVFDVRFAIVDAHQVRFAVDRNGHHDRVFWITVAASDAAGNRSTAVVTVRVAARRD